MVDRLMALCDTLEAGIRARDEALEAFAEAVCRAVLEGPATVAAPVPAAVRVRGSSGCRCNHYRYLVTITDRKPVNIWQLPII